MLTVSQLSAMRQVLTDAFAAPSNKDARDRAERSLRLRIITTPAYEDVSLDDGELWAERGARSHARYLHGFLFFTDWFGTILQDEQTRLDASRQALEIIQSWHDGPGRIGLSHTQAFHDETTAQRLTKLVRIYPHLAANLPESATRLIRPLMEQTAELLSDAQFHSSGNNHGMFQDLALLHYAILADWLNSHDRERYLTLALHRLREYFSSCFTSEGVHVENTPTYHIMVSRNLALVQRVVEAADHPDAEYYNSLLTNAEKYATHALMPNGLYPPISDTQQARVNGPRVLRMFRSQEFLYAATLGKQGRAPKEKVLVLPKTGYAIYRSAWGDPNATYAFFSAAYNSGYHKHSDDLSLYLRSMGIDLLSESGPYGYDYKHPFSRYAYSQFSHNSLVVDGKSLPRTDGRRSAVTLKLISNDPQGMVVQGINSRYIDTAHKRTINIDDSQGTPTISITDIIESETNHSYQLLWNLGSEVRAVLHGHGLELFRGTEKVMDMVISADVPIQMSLVKGRMKPRPLGWSFPKFGEAVPSEVISVRFSGERARIETAIRLADFSYRDRSITSRAGWKLHQGAVPVNYLLSVPPSGEFSKLVVVFSGLKAAGDFTCDYRETLEKLDVAALYILDDFGDQGSYYYSDHRSTAIFESVQSLIVDTMKINNISERDVATAGIDKGGSSAILHGLAIGVGRILAGFPHTRIGTHLRDKHPNVLKFMAGGTSDADVVNLDTLVEDALLRSNSLTLLSVLCSEEDHPSWQSLKSLIGRASTGLEISTHILENASSTGVDRRTLFGLYLRNNVEAWMQEKNTALVPYELLASKALKQVVLRVYPAPGTLAAYKLYAGSRLITSTGYTRNFEVAFSDLAPGVYRVRITSRQQGSKARSSFTTRRVVLDRP